MSASSIIDGRAIDEPPTGYLAADGTLVDDSHGLSDELLVDLFQHMLRTRTFDDRCLFLQRTGRIPAYYPCAGQEAHVAIPFTLKEQDFIYVAYREQGVRLARGVSVREELALFRGMPHAMWDPVERRISPPNATIGTHLPHAMGYGYGARLIGNDDIAVAIFGDGATSEVDFHAALNAAGVWKTPTIYYCQNNQYAQSTPLAQQTASPTLAIKADAYGMPGVRIDGMDAIAVYKTMQDAVRRARSGQGPTLIEAVCYRYSAHSTYDGTPVYRSREEEAEWRGRDPILRLRRYLEGRSLIDDGLVAEIEKATKAEVDAAIDELEALPMPPLADSFKGAYASLSPRVLEQLRERETLAGEEATEADPFDTDEQEPAGERRAMTMAEAINTELDYALANDPARLILGEDVGREGGIYRVTDTLYEKYGADRLLDTPLCELTIAGGAVGMAMAGAKPVAEIEFAGFTFTAFDQMSFHAARYAWRTFGKVRLPIVFRMPGGGGHEGFEGHSDGPEAMFAHIPGGMSVVYPSNARDAKGLLAAALESDDPVVFFEPVIRYMTREDDVPVEHYTIPLGKAKTVREGSDVTIVAYGNAVQISIAAAESLAADNVSVEVIDLRTLKPWDEAAVLASIEKTGRLVVVHEAPHSGGIGAEIVATVIERGGDYLYSPPRRVAHADIPWAPAKLEPQSMIRAERVAAAVLAVLED